MSYVNLSFQLNVQQGAAKYRFEYCELDTIDLDAKLFVGQSWDLIYHDQICLYEQVWIIIEVIGYVLV